MLSLCSAFHDCGPWCRSSSFKTGHVSAARATHHLEEGRGAEQLDCGVRQLPAAAKLRRRERLVQGVKLGERVHQPSHVVLGATVRAGDACGHTAMRTYTSYSICCVLCVVRVFFTLKRSFYSSTSSTTSVRADSSNLERCKLCGHKTTPRR